MNVFLLSKYVIILRQILKVKVGKMKVVKEAISSDYLSYKVDEDMVIYEGNFCIYLDKLYKCKGLIYYKISPPTLISFEAKVIGRQGKDLENIKTNSLNEIIELTKKNRNML